MVTQQPLGLGRTRCTTIPCEFQRAKIGLISNGMTQDDKAIGVVEGLIPMHRRARIRELGRNPESLACWQACVPWPVYFSLEMLYCPTLKKKFLLYRMSIPYSVPNYSARVYRGIMIRRS